MLLMFWAGAQLLSFSLASPYSWPQCSLEPALLGSPLAQSAWPSVDSMKAVDSPLRCHRQPEHAREDPQAAPAVTAARSLSPIHPDIPATAATSATERSVASVAPARRVPQLTAASAHDSAEENCLKQKDDDAPEGVTHPDEHRQSADASELYLPAAQGLHEEALVLPTSGLNVPCTR
jgi:hypothetical protein